MPSGGEKMAGNCFPFIGAILIIVSLNFSTLNYMGSWMNPTILLFGKFVNLLENITSLFTARTWFTLNCDIVWVWCSFIIYLILSIL
jgi:hypothetical protein